MFRPAFGLTLISMLLVAVGAPAQTVDELVQRSGATISGTSRLAIEAYSKHDIGAKVPLMVALLHHADMAKRTVADDPATAEDLRASLLPVLRDPKAAPEQRLSAMQKLLDRPKLLAPTDLIDALSDSHPGIRALAVAVTPYRVHKDREVLPKLLGLLGDEQLDRAARSAYRFGGMDVLPTALAEYGRAVVPGLAGVVADEKRSPFARTQAAQALGKIGLVAKPALPELEKNLHCRYANVAIESALAYVLTGGEIDKAMPTLKSGLDRAESTYLNWSTANALEKIGRKGWSAGIDLALLLRHNEREVRIAAARALATHGPNAAPAVGAIAELLRVDDFRQRVQIAEALAKLGADARLALSILIEQLERLDKPVPDGIFEAIGNLGPVAAPAVKPLLDLLKKCESQPELAALPAKIVDTFAKIGPPALPAVPVLVTFLTSESHWDRQSACNALGKIGPGAKAAVTALEKLRKDEQLRVRAWASYALAQIAGEDSACVPQLLELWKLQADGATVWTNEVRSDLAMILKQIGPKAEAARQPLLAVLDDLATDSRSAIDAAEVLIHLVKDSDVLAPKLLAVLKRVRHPEPILGDVQRARVIDLMGQLGPKAKDCAPELRLIAAGQDRMLTRAAEKALHKIEVKP